MSETVIEAEGIHAFYGASHVLQGVDLVVRRGETVGLMGRNGMGKTTLLRAIMGLVPQRRGTVRIKGVDMSRARAHAIARAGVAFVPEGRGIFPTLSVRENLMMAARTGAWTFERVVETFPRLGQRLEHGGGQLSGGEQQMLTIGRALMTNPDVLILDEATEGLAPLIRQEIWSTLEKLKAAGQSILVVDKNVDALARIADRHYIIEKGKVVWTGTSPALLADKELQHRYLGV